MESTAICNRRLWVPTFLAMGLMSAPAFGDEFNNHQVKMEIAVPMNAPNIANRAGDVDGDGKEDILFGPLTNGCIRAVSGKDGSLIQDYCGAPSSSQTIEATGLGDVDGDGLSDIAIGTPSFSGGRGQVSVHSGKTGSLLWSKEGILVNGNFGFSLARIMDIDGDGADDLLASTPFSFPGTTSILSGTNGALIRKITGTEYSAGFSIDRMGDVDFDGLDDIVVGVPYSNAVSIGVGAVEVFSSGTGQLLSRFDYLSPFCNFGILVAGLDDTNGDGTGDFLGASLGSSSCTANAVVINGGNGAWLHDHEFVSFGDSGVAVVKAVASGQDLNADGKADYALTVQGSGLNAPSKVMAFAHDGKELFELTGSSSFGNAIGLIPDITGTNRGELVVGDLNKGSMYSGDQYVTYYGESCGGGYGSPELVISGCPVPGQNAYVNLINSGQNLSAAMFIFGLNKTSGVPIGSLSVGCKIWVSPMFSAVVPTGPTGNVTLFATMPNLPTGATINLQAFPIDPFAINGFSVTRAASIEIY